MEVSFRRCVRATTRWTASTVHGSDFQTARITSFSRSVSGDRTPGPDEHDLSCYKLYQLRAGTSRGRRELGVGSWNKGWRRKRSTARAVLFSGKSAWPLRDQVLFQLPASNSQLPALGVGSQNKGWRRKRCTARAVLFSGQSAWPFARPGAIPTSSSQLPSSYANSSARIGNCRILFPVAAKIALHTAGAMPGVLASPIPPGAAWLGTICTSTLGISSMRTTSY